MQGERTEVITEHIWARARRNWNIQNHQTWVAAS